MIEAPGGYGKTTLLRAVADDPNGTVVSSTLDGPTDVGGMLAGLAASSRRAGLRALGDLLVRPATPAAEVAEFVDRLGRPVRFVVDEIQAAAPEAVRWLVELVRVLPTGSALLVAGRRVPAELVRELRRSGGIDLDRDDLRFSVDEIRAVLEASVAAPGAAAVDAVQAVTGGWPAAVAVAIAAIGLSTERLVELGDGSRLMTELVHRLLEPIDPASRERLAALATLPILDATTAALAVGPGGFDLLLDAGLPVATRADGWRYLPDPVRDVLRGEATIPVESRRAVAEHYARRGHLAVGVTLLDRADDHAGVLALLAARPWTELREFGLVTLDVVLQRLDDAILRHDPTLLLRAAHAAELSDPERRVRWLERAVSIARDLSDDAVERAALAELAREAVRRADLDVAERLATDALDGAGLDESATRARALVALAHVDTVRATPAHLRDAEARLEEAIALFRRVDEPEWEADALLRLGYAVSFQGGRLERALDQIGHCLALLPAPDRSRGNALSHFAEVLGVAGRSDEADAAAREGLAIGRRLGDSWVIGACAWSAMIVAAHRGDLEATRWWIDQVERSPGPWLEVGNGVEFLMEASDLLAANGDEAGARHYYRLAAERIEVLGIPDALDQLTVRIESTFGDPVRADELLAAVDDSNFAVQRNRWVRRLLRAQAALRRGDVEATRRYAEEAVRELDRLGDLGLLWRTEPRLAATLAEFLPSREGRADAGWTVSLFGVFGVEVDGVDRTPAPGHPSNLVKLLALRGPVPVDEAIEFLWPEVGASAGRARLRNLLNRIRDRSGDLVIRRGGSLCLADGATVDVTRFEELARAALAAGGAERVGTARRALGLHRGDLLVGDVYADWTVGHRERLRRLHLSLVDVVVDHALGLGDLDDALALLDTAIAAEPLDERRYLVAADALDRQGRRQQARAVLDRAVEVLGSAGVPIGAELRRRTAP